MRQSGVDRELHALMTGSTGPKRADVRFKGDHAVNGILALKDARMIPLGDPLRATSSPRRPGAGAGDAAFLAWCRWARPDPAPCRSWSAMTHSPRPGWAGCACRAPFRDR